MQGMNGLAGEIYEGVKNLPIVSPHGHCDPAWFSENLRFSDPADLLIIPDHYVFRMLYSQGIPLEALGIGVDAAKRNPREIFGLFASNWHLFLGTPSRQWLDYTFKNILGIELELSAETSDQFYDLIEEKLRSEAFLPRNLFDRFNIEVLATTDGALDDLGHHQAVVSSGWAGRIVPTFRPDSVLNPAHADFAKDLKALGDVTDCDTGNIAGYRDALRKRRAYFKANGATATDHDVPDLQTEKLSESEIDTLFNKVTVSDCSQGECIQFYNHMLIEMAEMSVEDGLVMQLHVGSARSTNEEVMNRFGPDKGADIPKPVNFVKGLDGLLNRVGNNPDLTVLVFTLDETTYARELAPMAGHWPAMKLGPPWWFHDSANGIARYFDQVVESAGYWNLAGFNDDTRAFLSIPARHDVWRQGVGLHLAGQVERGQFGRSDAYALAKMLSHDLAMDTYNLRLG